MSSRYFFIPLVPFLPLLMVLGYWIHFRGGSLSGKEQVSSVVFHDGDLIFRRGRSAESMAVYLADPVHDFSHIEIVVMDAGKPFVIHAVPGEQPEAVSHVVKEPVNAFLDDAKASHWAVYRSKLSLDKLKKVTLKALDFFNRRAEFDNDYDLEDDSRLYCTELVMKAFQAAGLERRLYPEKELKFVMGTKKILFPGVFIQSPDFFRVCSY
jgi:hypothetical protein